jgi:hypothetical protein
MKSVFQAFSSLVIFISLSSVTLAGGNPSLPKAGPAVNEYGIQTVTGMPALAIYNTIKEKETELRELSVPDDSTWHGSLPLTFYKTADVLECWSFPAGEFSCTVTSGKDGKQVSIQFPNVTLSRIYETISSLVLKSGSPLGSVYSKRVGDLFCTRMASSNQYSCDIRFRQ